MKTQNPLIGRSKGSAGGMTASKVYDKNVLRAKAFEVNNPNTAAQQSERGFFAELTALCCTFSEEQLSFLFPTRPKSMSRRNAITRQLSSCFEMQNGAKQMDLSDLYVLGNPQRMNFGETTCTMSTGTITATLDESISGSTEYADLYFFCAVVNETRNEIYLPEEAVLASVGTLSFSAPSNWEGADVIHPIPMLAKPKGSKKDGQIALVGFGTMGVTKGPGSLPQPGPTPPTPPTPTPQYPTEVEASASDLSEGSTIMLTADQSSFVNCSPGNLNAKIGGKKTQLTETNFILDTGNWIANLAITLEGPINAELQVLQSGQVIDNVSCPIVMKE